MSKEADSPRDVTGLQNAAATGGLFGASQRRGVYSSIVRSLVQRASVTNCQSALRCRHASPQNFRFYSGETPKICPTGKSLRFSVSFLSSPSAKNISLSPSGKSNLQLAPSRPARGALRGRHERWVRDAVDVDGAVDERRLMRTAKSCGPDAPTLASSSRKATFAGDGGKKARSPGRARRKPLKPLRREGRD
jgi:hypothetical protein